MRMMYKIVLLNWVVFLLFSITYIVLWHKAMSKTKLHKDSIKYEKQYNNSHKKSTEKKKIEDSDYNDSNKFSFINRDIQYDVSKLGILQSIDGAKKTGIPEVKFSALPMLEPKQHKTQCSKPVVPNIVHLIWFSSDKYTKLPFCQLLCILAMLKVQKPDSVYFWYDSLPEGEWWEYLMTYVSEHIVDFQLRKAEVPTHIYGKEILKMEHKGDVFKLQCLQKYGGIYIDMDVMMINPYTPLLCYNFTLGSQGKKLNSGNIVSAPGSPFIDHWWEMWKKRFIPTGWQEASVDGATHVAKEHPELIHIEESSMNIPGSNHKRLIYDGHFNWTDKYSVHMWALEKQSYITPESIKYMDSAAGEMLRLVWFGETKLFDRRELLQKISRNTFQD